MGEIVETDQPLTLFGRIFAQPEMYQVIRVSIVVESPIDIDAVRAEVQSSIMVKHPRFRILMVRGPNGREYWRRTEIDFDRHIIVRHQPLSDDPSVSDEDSVNDFVADLTVSSPLAMDKPLWEVHLLMAHRAAVFRFHHALGDGISMMTMLLSCYRRADDPTQPPTVHGVGAASTAPQKGWRVLTLVKMVWYTLVYVLEFTLTALWMRDKTTAVSGGAGVELWPRKLATARFQLDDMKIVKRSVPNALSFLKPNG